MRFDVWGIYFWCQNICAVGMAGCLGFSEVSPRNLWGFMIQFDEHMFFSTGWLSHQLMLQVGGLHPLKFKSEFTTKKLQNPERGCLSTICNTLTLRETNINCLEHTLWMVFTHRIFHSQTLNVLWMYLYMKTP